MQAVELTKAIPAEGLAEGDVIEVDELSAASMIAAKKAKAYEAGSETAAADALEEVQYGGQTVRTIDDIVDPDAKRMKGVMHVQRLVGADPGPARTGTAKSVQEAESAGEQPAEQPAITDTTEAPKRGRGGRGASGAEPAGGDADGGAAGS